MKLAEQTGKRRSKLKLFEIVLGIGLAAALLWGASALNTQQALADKVVRLHILANSDSQADQALKLRVRDAVLVRATEILERSADRDEAETALRAALPELEALAAAEIAAQGYGYGVTARLTDEPFPTREYEGFTLPAGNYLALRLLIGEAAGHNWWCVVFPPLCTTAATDVPAAAMAAGLDEEDVRLITGDGEGYVLKFKSIELWEGLREKFEN